MHSVYTLRAELWAALLGWQPGEAYDVCKYEGGQLLALDRARLWYQFEFSAALQIGPADGWQDRSLVGLPYFDGINFRADFIEPADPNLANPGPDGRDEVTFTAPASGNLP